MADLKAVPDAKPVPKRPLQDQGLDLLLAVHAKAAENLAEAQALVKQFAEQAREIEVELVERMREAKAKRLPHPHWRVALEPQGSPKLNKIDSAFLPILSMLDIPERERQEMVIWTQPEPVLRTDARALKKYADQYGPTHPLWEIRQRALQYDDPKAVLVIEPVLPPKKGLQP